MAPVYVVLTRRRVQSNNRVLLPGPYNTLEEIAGFIAPSGPPLPLIVKCDEAEFADLLPINDAIDKIGGGDTLSGAETFVKAMISEIRDLEIWSNKPIFYCLLNSPSVRKFIAPEYRDVVDYRNATNDFTLYTTPTFIGGLVYSLVGGNDKLRLWGLEEWVAKPRERNIPSPRAIVAPPTYGKKSVSSPTPKRGLGGSRIMPETGKSMGRPDEQPQTAAASTHDDSDSDDDGVFMVPGSFGKGKHPLFKTPARSSSNVKARSASNVKTSPEFQRMSLPERLVPSEYLDSRDLSSNPVAFIVQRIAQENRFITLTPSNAPIVSTINGPLREHERLPSVLVFYLRAHGWSDSVIGVVASAYVRNMDLLTFLSLTSRAMVMPLTEASFLWHLMQFTK